MNYLLDTHIWIWSLSSPEKLSQEVRIVLAEASNRFFLSAISVWEFLVLVEKGKISVKTSVEDWLESALNQSGIEVIPIDKEVAVISRNIDLPHQDPADRFIAATAQVNRLTLITSDSKLSTSKEIPILFNKR